MRVPAAISFSMHAAFIAVFLVGGRYERMSLGGLGPGDFTPVTLVGADALRGRAPVPTAPKVAPAPKAEEKTVEPPKPRPKPSEEGVKIPDEKKKPAKAKADTTAQASMKEPAPKQPARPAAKSSAEEALAGATETNAGHGGAVASGIEVGLGGEGGGGGGGGGGGFGEFSYYQVAMQNKIAAHWSPGFISGEAVAIVYFRIIRSGTIVGARVEESSGIPFYDQTALRAVLEASPLPPLPAQFPDDAVGVHFRFRFRP